ncbi:hypothetical protein R1X32_09025 (plasmid) [Rhodococcus opacus]|uniref:hypothetical protein n=1 Tax=Rhodococcus opacus TaxID=37919 RepID=UPI0005C1E942|nr:hypothetical protein [Rhodococcus opacus]MDV6248024.1 hypothetical protein [Rhodococcus opacus]WKN59895.1 hypothetical protein HJ581_0039280 [Rhodococcus opacus]
MTTEQRGALEHVRDTYAVLRTFMRADNTGVPARVWGDTYRQLTGDLMNAVGAARIAGVPEHVIFDCR